MKRLVVLIVMAVTCLATAAQGLAKASPYRFDLAAISVGQVIQLLYAEAITTPFVLDPEVLADSRSVSFRFSTDRGDLKAFLRAFLGSLGYVVETRDGVDFIAKRKTTEAQAIEPEVFVYIPKFRDVPYLAKLLGPLFKGGFSVNRGISSPGSKSDKSVADGSAAAMLDQSADALVFSGEAREVEMLRKLLPQVDTVVGEVVVRGVVYEVSSSDKSGSAFGLLASVVGGKLSAGIGGASNVGTFVRLKSTSLDLIYAALSNDNRFKVLSSPSLRIRSGARGRFSVGQDVPVLGALSYAQGSGQAIQSVEYRSSGVIFDIQPMVRESVIELSIDQQLSNFVATTTGVNNSPTLTKRALQTSVGLQDGDVIVLGGLTENRESQTRDGLSFLPRMLDTKGAENSRSEILLVLQVQKL
ncbi:type II secretion system protein GspD [Ideonella sp.]|jgi:general secretion pathway protein D|uniref:type II secretion system protein GspD n=1 Tax=Ideonella sp. TaxID=1929293 RepID=UPI0037C14F15